MNRSAIATRFADNAASGRKALIPYLMSGFPDAEKFRELVHCVLDEDVDLLEIGIPFSDPLADGPVIQAAGQRALEQQTTTEQTLGAIAEFHAHADKTPFVIMSYFNPIRAFGIDKFAAACKTQQVSGWIIPDRDLDSVLEIDTPARQHGIDLIPLLAPTTPESRIASVVESASGFVYLVSVTGVTGARKELSADLTDYAGRVRRNTSLPICIGFGISGKEQAEQAAKISDGVIVGSALLEPFLRLRYPAAKQEMLQRLRDVRRGLGR